MKIPSLPHPDPSVDALKRVPVLPEDAHLSGAQPRAIECDPKHLHPYHKASAPSTAAFDAQHGVVLRPNPMAIGLSNQTLDGSADPQTDVPINSGRWFRVETDHWVGRIFVAVRGLPNSDPRLFEGKKRLTHIVTQGRNKAPVPADETVIGQEFIKVPPRHLLKGMMMIGDLIFRVAAKQFSNTVKVSGEAGYMFNSSLPTCQVVQVSRPGEEPEDPMAMVEDMTLWEPSLVDAKGCPLSSEQRRKWTDTPANLATRSIGPEYVWTCHSWQHHFDFATYRLHLGLGLSIDLVPLLLGQPLHVTIKNYATGDYMFSLLLWHRRLVHREGEDAESAVEQAGHTLSGLQAASGSLSGLKKGLVKMMSWGPASGRGSEAGASADAARPGSAGGTHV